MTEVKMLRKNCTLDYKVDGDELTVFISGEIDHYSAVRLRAEIDAKISEIRPRTTLLVLEKIDFMDSSGIGFIMGRYARMQKLGGALRLINPSERVERICRLAGLERIVAIETNEKIGENNGNDKNNSNNKESNGGGDINGGKQ
jgi:stage II sporulation protein AA (anti-sigma F factor antagonist)